jgi:hypothetical protein
MTLQHSLLTGEGRLRVTLRQAQGEFMVSLSNHPPPLIPLPLREGRFFGVIFYLIPITHNQNIG